MNPIGDVLGTFAASLKALSESVLSALASLKGLSEVMRGAAPVWKALNTEVKTFGESLKGLGKAVSEAVIPVVSGLALLGGSALVGGLEVFGQVLQYVVAVVGSVLAPVFVAVAAAVMTVADVFRTDLLVATKAVAGWLADNLMPAIQGVAYWIQQFVDSIRISGKLLQIAFVGIIEGLAKAIHYVLDKIPGLGSTAAAVGSYAEGAQQVREGYQAEASQIAAGMSAREREYSRTGSTAKGREFSEKYGKNFDAVIQGLTSAMGQKGQVGFSGIGDIGKTIQNAAFQNDIQAKTLKVQTDTLDEIRGMRRDIQRQDNSAVGR